MRAGAKRLKGLDTSRFSPLQLEEIPEPELPTPRWVRIKPLLCGICGSDLGTLSAESSPYFSPLTSPPFVMGHEIVGQVVEDQGGLDRKSTRLNSSHANISYAVFCLKKKKSPLSVLIIHSSSLQ